MRLDLVMDEQIDRMASRNGVWLLQQYWNSFCWGQTWWMRSRLVADHRNTKTRTWFSAEVIYPSLFLIIHMLKPNPNLLANYHWPNDSENVDFLDVLNFLRPFASSSVHVEMRNDCWVAHESNTIPHGWKYLCSPLTWWRVCVLPQEPS